jgi:hypothetical protein
MGIVLDFMCARIEIERASLAVTAAIYSLERTKKPAGVQADRCPPMAFPRAIWPFPHGRGRGGIHPKSRRVYRRVPQAHRSQRPRPHLDHGCRWWRYVFCTHGLVLATNSPAASVVYSTLTQSPCTASSASSPIPESTVGRQRRGQTYEYARTISKWVWSSSFLILIRLHLVDLITGGTPHPQGKILIISGGIGRAGEDFGQRGGLWDTGPHDSTNLCGVGGRGTSAARRYQLQVHALARPARRMPPAAACQIVCLGGRRTVRVLHGQSHQATARKWAEPNNLLPALGPPADPARPESAVRRPKQGPLHV